MEKVMYYFLTPAGCKIGLFFSGLNFALRFAEKQGLTLL